MATRRHLVALPRQGFWIAVSVGILITAPACRRWLPLARSIARDAGSDRTGAHGPDARAADADAHATDGSSPDADATDGSGPDADAHATDGSGPDTGPEASDDAGALATPEAIAGACDLTLPAPRAPDGAAGTLAAPGPFRPCRVIGGHNVTGLRFSGDGRRVAALGAGGQVVVLDAVTLAPIATLVRARGRYTSVALSFDGARAAAGAEIDGELDVWSVDDESVLRAVDLGPAWPTFGGAIAISPDGARAAAGTGLDTAVVEVASGDVRRFPGTSYTSALYFVAGGSKLAAARYRYWSAGTGSGSAALLDILTGAETTLVEHQDIYGGEGLAVSADGGAVLTYRGGGDSLAVWDAATGIQRTAVPWPASGVWTVLGLGSDGAEVGMLLSSNGPPPAVRFQRLRAADLSPVAELALDPAPVYGNWAWSPRGDRLLATVIAAPGRTVLASVTVGGAGATARACMGPAVLSDASLSRDAARLLAGSNSGAGFVFDVASGAALGPGPDGLTTAYSAALAPDGRHVVTSLLTPSSSDWTTSVPPQLEVDDVDSGARQRLSGLLPARTVGDDTPVFSGDSLRVAARNWLTGELDVFAVDDGRLLSEVQRTDMNETLLGFTDDGGAIQIVRSGQTIDTVRWTDGAVTATWALPARTSFRSFAAGVVAAIDDAGDTVSVYRDGALVTSMPFPKNDCFGMTPMIQLSPDASLITLAVSCSRPYSWDTRPQVEIRDATTGAPVQRVFLPSQRLLFAVGGRLFLEGDTAWCR